MVYQIRDTYGAARKILQTDNPKEVKQFLSTRCPDHYQIFGMAGDGMELRFVQPAREFLKEITKREACDG